MFSGYFHYLEEKYWATIKNLIVIILTVLAVGFISCRKEDTGKDLTIFCEVLKPYNYQENGVLKGIAADAVSRILQDLKLDNTIRITTNWDSIYNLLQTQENTMVLTTVMTPVRKPLFKWVGPVCKKKYCFYVAASSDYQINTIDDARHMRSVGTVTEWASEQELLDLGFNNVVTWATPQEVFQKLMDGDIPCAVLSNIGMRMIGLETGHPPKDYRQGATLSETPNYLAYSKDTDPAYLTTMQNAYSLLVSSGKLAEIWKKWYPDIIW